MGSREGNPTWRKKVLDRTMTRGWLKVVLGLETPNVYELHAKKTQSNAWTPKQTTVDMACPNKANKTEKQAEKIQKYQQLPYELLERHPRFMVKVVPIVIGCSGDGIKQLDEDIRDLFIKMERFKIVDKVQKNVLWESKFIVRRVVSGLINWMFSI